MIPIDLYGQTGGGRGIGRAMAQALAAAGATVAVLSRSPSELAESVTLIERAGGRASAFPLDVLNAAAVAETLAEIARALGPLDLLVNNAGDGGPVGPLEETDPALWWHTQEVNLRGPMLCTHAVLPGMIERRHGRIINVSSGAAEISLAYLSSYIVSKAALNKMTELLAVETKQYGIAMFAISPGAVHTAMSEAFLKSEKAAKWMPWFRPMFAEHAVPPERQRPKLWRVSVKRDAVKPARRNFETRLASRIFPSNCLSPLRRGGGDCVLQPCGEVRLRLSGGSGRAVDAASIALACFDGEAPVRSSRLTTGPEVNVGTDDSAYSRGSDRYPGKMRIVQPRNLLHLVLASGFSLSAQVGPFAGSVSLTSVSNQVVALPKGPNPVFTNVVVDATAAGGGSIDVNVGDPTSYGTSESIATSEKPPLRRFRSMDCRSPNLNPAHRIST